MKNFFARAMNFVSFAILLPVISGCQGGGGGGLSFLGGGSGGDSGGFVGGGGDSIATIHNPEPATMLLMGSGLAAMAWYKSKGKTK